MRVRTLICAFLAPLPRLSPPGTSFFSLGGEQVFPLLHARRQLSRGIAMPPVSSSTGRPAPAKNKSEGANKAGRKDEKGASSSQPELPRFMRIVDGGMTIAVHAKPGAKQSQIPAVSEQAEQLDIQINAPAREGAANEELCDFIADTLKLKKRDVTLQSGHKSREKVLLIQTTRSPAELLETLKQHSEEAS
ncbi:ACR, YggU family COG1872 domain-containing protein [Besnoitia besnoiti]|uniref:ACR, YggU family COG1872 domain-containing protein n=1 Tax=Besnoitia besnoiti TaxID=94643 RepID=A0A2A9MCE6_BESBE|nr:ACR, YggU family COG1872 domain-containing protein [Besnoitia besnoiti]PFH34894.1 ACR, YggU family COG1872 domain-containing protein [Besnoitia besnoiti]